MAEVWEKQQNESSKAFKAFATYRDMGAERSLTKVAQACGKSVSICNRWSSLHQWVARAQAYDQHLEDIAQEAKEAEIKRVLSEGYAQMHERVRELNAVAGKIRGWVDEEAKVWIEKREEITTENATIVKTELKFNQALFQEFRGFLDDLAKEVGGRIRKTETSFKALPKQYIGLDELIETADEDEE